MSKTYEPLATGEIALVKNGKIKKVYPGKNALEDQRLKRVPLITQSQIDWLRSLFQMNGDILDEDRILNLARGCATDMILELQKYGKPVTKRIKNAYRYYTIDNTHFVL